jgi:hypothetical protein
MFYLSYTIIIYQYLKNRHAKINSTRHSTHIYIMRITLQRDNIIDYILDASNCYLNFMNVLVFNYELLL